MRVRRLTISLVAVVSAGALALPAAPAAASPVCTDGYMGGPPRAVCGGRIFPESYNSTAYVQYQAAPNGFREYQHGLEYLAQQYPRWVSVFTLRDWAGNDDAVTAGFDEIRPYEEGDTGDGFDILVVKLTDHEVPDEGKETLLFSLSVHGNERGGLEGGLRTAEDLAVAAEEGGTIVDGIDNYESTTGREPTFNEYEVADVLAKEVVYLVDYNIDGWAYGDFWAGGNASLYARGNSLGTDLNRQMPTVGRINWNRNPLQESEMAFGLEHMEEVAAAGRGGLMAYGADVHGELTSNAYVDVMYPAGQFDSVDHRRLMAIAERTKSVIDATLYAGIIDQIEEATGGNQSEPPNIIPTKPAHWATVWDTLGYTDTGFIGDYLATDLAVTGMDYEIFLNHFVPERVWNVYLQENHINATRGIIKTAMAYALTQSVEFNQDNVVVDPVGTAGYVFNPDTVAHDDENGPGRLPGPEADGIGDDGQPVEQRPYSSTNMRWFTDTDRLLPTPFVRLHSGDIAASATALDTVDTVVLADFAVPADPQGRQVDAAAYWQHIGDWVRRGGNLVLTDRAVHGLADLGVVPADAVQEIGVYLPFTDIADFEHAMVEGLRPNARQLVDTTLLGYGINSDEVGAWMTVVDQEAFEGAEGAVVGTSTGEDAEEAEVTGVSVGQLPLGEGQIRVVGGALPTATEDNDHRYGLRDYAMTYTALYIMENSIVHDVPHLGASAAPPPAAGGPGPGSGAPGGAGSGAGAAPGGALPATGGGLALLGLLGVAAAARLRRRVIG